ncbi:hypothetical protein BZL30_9508 [Mycobacterium kansasii]|uniref:Uncharacterized protein n=1 Tax=Mycobacterium kansasii TaxID=1768 RepID=A0A1V3W8J2_MYCKA|nr:hypothetical protein BZL30_9508 [Mycobacterium kansasii]
MVSLLIVALTIWYYTINVNPQVSAEYGLYVGGGAPVRGGLLPVGGGRRDPAIDFTIRGGQ